MRDLQSELNDAIDAGDLEAVLELTELLEQADRERAKRGITEALLMLGIMPRSLVRERYVS